MQLLLTVAAVCTGLVIGLTAQEPVVPKSPTPAERILGHARNHAPGHRPRLHSR